MTFYGIGVEKNGQWRKLELKGGMKNTQEANQPNEVNINPNEWHEYFTGVQNEIEQVGNNYIQRYNTLTERFVNVRNQAITAVEQNNYNDLIEYTEELRQIRTETNDIVDQAWDVVHRLHTEGNTATTWNMNHPNAIIPPNHLAEIEQWLTAHHQMHLTNATQLVNLHNSMNQIITRLDLLLESQENLAPQPPIQANTQERHNPPPNGRGDLRRI